MKAAIYNPYLDTLGGGERYTISFIKVLLENDWRVDVQWKNSDIKNKLIDRLGIDIDKANIVGSVDRGDGYDLCFWVSDGSIPLLRSRNNILHFQVPFTDVDGKSLMNKMKLFRIKSIVCNSTFTKSVIDKEYGVKSVVVYPPVDTKKFSPKRKQNKILYVGRFSSLMQNKAHDLLIKVFIKMVKESHLGNWELVLIGGSDVGDEGYVKKLKEESNGYNIKIIENASLSELKKYYSISKIFWSAAGYSVNQEETPSKVEHFGITIVEAMAAGCVPVVLDSGGHKEIVTPDSGVFWSTKNQLVKNTLELVNNNQLREQLAQKAIIRSDLFSYENFKKEITKLL